MVVVVGAAGGRRSSGVEEADEAEGKSADQAQKPGLRPVGTAEDAVKRDAEEVVHQPWIYPLLRLLHCGGEVDGGAWRGRGL